MVLKYAPAQHDTFAAAIGGFDALVVRVEPGAMDEGDTAAFAQLMHECSAGGSHQVWGSADGSDGSDGVIRLCANGFEHRGCAPIAELQAGVAADKSAADLSAADAAAGQRVADVAGLAVVDALCAR